MPGSTLTTIPFGPFDGVVDTRNPSIPLAGKLRNAKNLVFQGGSKLAVQNGTAVTFTLKDDAGSPATVTSVLAVRPFMDGGVAIAYSSVTQKVYLYRLTDTMTGWYDSTGALQATASPQPCAVLWTSVAAVPDVFVDEGLGTLYVTQTGALDASGLYFPTKQVTFSSAGVPTVASLAASGTGGSAGADSAHFTALWSFHQHLFGVGYGAGAVAGFTSYRPELLRFSGSSFGAFQTIDSIVLGDRVRALRERVLGGAVAGNALLLGASKALFRVTGYGRDSWVVETVDEQYGLVGPKAGVSAGGVFYGWSSRGPYRCAESGPIQPLWDAVPGAVATVANESKIVAAFDASTDRVLFTYDAGSGVRTLCAFDTRRDAFVSVDGDMGLVIACAGVVEPIAQSTATPPAAPTAPTIVSTTSVATTSAQCNWTAGDSLAEHEVSYRVQGAPSYTTLPLQAAGVVYCSLSGLSAGTAYEWRIRAVKNGGYSSYVGPTAASQFTTTGGGGPPPAAPTGLSATQRTIGTTIVDLAWTNADPTLTTQVWRSTDGTTFFQQDYALAGASTLADDPGAFGLYYYYVQHAGSGGTLGAASSVVSVSVSPTV